MDERPVEQGPRLRRAGLRALPTPTDLDLVVSDAPPLSEVAADLPEPRLADLDALLREVDTLRCSMRRDLSLAATAVAVGADDMAGWLLLGQGGEVRAFEERALAHLAAATTEPVPAAAPVPSAIPAPRRRPWLPAAPLVAAAAAIVGFLTGAVPTPGGSGVTTPATSNAALQSYAQLARLASDGASPNRLNAAAVRFHQSLAPLVASARTNPAAAEKALALLQSERAVMAGESDSPVLRAVLAQADALVLRLQATLPRRTTRVVVPAVPVPHDEQRTSPAPKSSPAPRPTPSPTPSAAASPTAAPKPSQTPASAPKPSPSPSDAGPLPHSPGTLPV